jgi:hypothetical protein
MTSHRYVPKVSKRLPWSRERLIHARAAALSLALERSTSAVYSSALQSYLRFCHIHGFGIEPTPQTMSFYVVYMCHHISPNSIATYLSGIIHELEPFYPSTRDACHHRLVTKTLQGCKKDRATNKRRKRALTRAELRHVVSERSNIQDHDVCLWIAILCTAFHGLLRLGELVDSDNPKLRNPRKTIQRRSLRHLTCAISFSLPGHKADRFFEGNTVLLNHLDASDDPVVAINRYLHTRDHMFPFNPELWIKADGNPPTRSWFLHRLRRLFPGDIGGHSLRSGGATALAETGTPPHLIQAAGRWSSDAFQIYIRKHPLLLAALLTSDAQH